MLKYADIVKVDDCTGCESCIASCAHAAIMMKSDKRGFKYPWIESNACVKCGACERACPVRNDFVSDNRPKGVYAARTASDAIIDRSSSGGLFSELALEVLNNGGCICGAVFNDDFSVSHTVIIQADELGALRGSKYVQSSCGAALPQLRKMLARGGNGMYVGTACQVAGARKLLGTRLSERCLFVEVVCHGVPSPGVFEKYRNELEVRFGSKIESINFRDKRSGWRDYRLSVKFCNGEEYSVPGHQDPYVSGFVEDFFIRTSCHNCRFKEFKSGADITIGDFWGVQALGVEAFKDNRGVSLVCVNSDKGAEMFAAVRDRLADVHETKLEVAVAKNPCLVRSTPYNKRTKRFYKYLQKMPVSIAVDETRKTRFLDKVENCLRYRLGLDK